MKAVCLFSGGVDSTTLLYHLLSAGAAVKAVSFDYGQKHRKELAYARRTCAKLNIEHQVIDLTTVNPLLKGSALTDKTVAVPEGGYGDETMALTVVPNRNMMFMAIAGAYAVSEKADVLAIAVHAGDHGLYPDCRPEFIDAFEKSLAYGNYHQVKVYAPYLLKSKKAIVKEGRALGIDFEADTWSCYLGGERPCGKCGTCLERTRALSKT
jgi:7-cyano-7-deazaguanine synthase